MGSDALPFRQNGKCLDKIHVSQMTHSTTLSPLDWPFHLSIPYQAWSPPLSFWHFPVIYLVGVHTTCVERYPQVTIKHSCVYQEPEPCIVIVHIHIGMPSLQHWNRRYKEGARVPSIEWMRVIGDDGNMGPAREVIEVPHRNLTSLSPSLVHCDTTF